MMEALPPWCVRILAELEAADARALAVARSLGEAQLNWKADASEWSVGQCLDHLVHANETYGRSLSDALHGRASGPVDEIRLGGLGQWFLRNYIEPRPKTKQGRAPKKLAPVSRVDAGVLDRFLASNREAREIVRRAAGHDVNRLRFRNPYVPLLRFTVGTGFEILAKHESRHLLQAERIRVAVGFPAG